MSEDTPESVRAVIATLLGEHNYHLSAAISALHHYAALLERSAGEWVKVGERLPTFDRYTTVATVLFINGYVFLGRHSFEESGADLGPYVTHWLDVKLPGGE